VRYQCPVCGYAFLFEQPRSPNSGGGSYEICRSCGFQFGVTDDDRGFSYDDWPQLWIDAGMPWSDQTSTPPLDWDPAIQLSGLDRAR
jgi:hypothetical protein